MWGWLALFGIEIFVQNKNRKIRAQNIKVIQQSLAEGGIEILPNGSDGLVIVQGETDPQKIAAAKAFREEQERLELQRLEKNRLAKKRRQKWALIVSVVLILFALLFNLTSGMRERSKAGGQIAEGPQVCYAPDHYAQLVRGIIMQEPYFKTKGIKWDSKVWQLPQEASDWRDGMKYEAKMWLHEHKLCTNPAPDVLAAGGVIATTPITCDTNERLAMLARGAVAGKFAPFQLNENWTYPIFASHFDEARNSEMKQLFINAGLCLTDAKSAKVQKSNDFESVTPTKVAVKPTPVVVAYVPSVCPQTVSSAVTTLRALQKYKKETGTWANRYDLSYFDYKSGSMLNDYFTTEVNGKTGLADFAAKLFAEGLCLGTR